MEVTAADAEHLLTELRRFAAGLGPAERALLGALVAPAFSGAALPEVLSTALRTHPDAMSALGLDALDR